MSTKFETCFFNIPSNNAQLALRALAMRSSCGEYAARRYAERRGISGLYRLACQLAAVDGRVL